MLALVQQQLRLLGSPPPQLPPMLHQPGTTPAPAVVQAQQLTALQGPFVPATVLQSSSPLGANTAGVEGSSPPSRQPLYTHTPSPRQLLFLATPPTSPPPRSPSSSVTPYVQHLPFNDHGLKARPVTPSPQAPLPPPLLQQVQTPPTTFTSSGGMVSANEEEAPQAASANMSQLPSAGSMGDTVTHLTTSAPAPSPPAAPHSTSPAPPIPQSGAAQAGSLNPSWAGPSDLHGPHEPHELQQFASAVDALCRLAVARPQLGPLPSLPQLMPTLLQFFRHPRVVASISQGSASQLQAAVEAVQGGGARR